MDHDHNHHKSDNIKVAFFLNAGFTLIELVGGLLTNSVAIIADSLHDFGDSLSLGLSWWLQKYSSKGRSKSFSYGYRRFSLLGAIINSIVLIVGSIFVLREVIPRLVSPQASHAPGMLLLAILGIAVNGAAVLKLKHGTSLNERVVSWHLLEDVLGWVAVLIVSIINLFISLPILDPLLAVIFTCIVVLGVFKSLKKAVKIFLQSVPSNISLAEIENKIKEMKEVVAVHDIHAWSLDGEHHVLTLHIVLQKGTTHSKICIVKGKVKNLAHKMHISHTTVEVELEGEECTYEDC